MSQALEKSTGVLPRKIFIFWGIFLSTVIACAVMGYLAKTKPARLERKAQAVFSRAKQTINPEDLRLWALGAISDCVRTNGSAVVTGIQASNIPGSIATLCGTPFHAVVEQPEEGGEPFVSIMWDDDAAGCDWWLTIGSRRFVAFSNAVVQYGYYQTGVWAPGIYFNCRHQAKAL